MSATSLTPQAACQLIEAKAKAAVQKLSSFKVYEFPKEPVLTIKFKRQLHAELLGLLPIAKRTGAYEIQYQAKNYVEVMKFLRFVTKYNATDT
jgi:D-aminopeptidase